MVNTNQIAEIGHLIGDPSRAAMLLALMDGRALTASELARAASITPQTASSHVARLTAAGLLVAAKQGRFRYHRLASPEIAALVESLLQVAQSTGATGLRSIRTGPRDHALRMARTCYDHFAGRLGVAITDALIARGAILFEDGAGVMTPDGETFFAEIGLLPEKAPIGRQPRPLCRPCLDWSERRDHLAGRLGAEICAQFLARRYVRHLPTSRAVVITRIGQSFLRDHFAIDWAMLARPGQNKTPGQS